MMQSSLPNVRIKEAATIACVSEQTIRRWIKQGLLKAVKIGGGYRTTPEWIQELSKPANDTVAIEFDRKKENDGYDAAVRNLKSRFGLKTKKLSGC